MKLTPSPLLVPPLPPNTNSTKYDIDPSLTGKDRAKAKKNAAKRLKKEAKRQLGDDGDEGESSTGDCGWCSYNDMEAGR